MPWVYIGTSPLKAAYVGTTPVKEIYVWTTKVRPNSRLPSAYQEVEWIQSSWTQWVNTWLFASNNIQVETKVEVTTTSQNIPIFWWNWGNSGYVVYRYYHLTPYNSKWYFWKNWTEGNLGTYSAVVGTVYTIVYNNSNSQLSINGSEIGSVAWTVWVPNSTLAISYRFSPGNTAYYWKWKYFYFRMYDKSQNKYVRDFVPCYRKSDNIIWLYDLANNQFYTNAWTWTFTKWPNV